MVITKFNHNTNINTRTVVLQLSLIPVPVLFAEVRCAGCGMDDGLENGRSKAAKVFPDFTDSLAPNKKKTLQSRSQEPCSLASR